MGKIRNPGSKPGVLPARGRPKKLKAKERSNKGNSRVGNYRTKYTQEMLQEAIEAVKEGGMAVRQAARQFGVPKTTLVDRLAER